MVKRDVVLWLKHLEKAGMPVPPGCSAVFRVGDVEILFQPMRPGPGGRPTPGLRAAGANRGVWSSIPLGTVIDFELVRVLAEDTAASPGDVGPRFSRTYKATSHEPSSAANESFDAVALPPSRTPAFDAYIMVDWSAASAPKRGKDSVWWCLCAWRGGRLVMEENENLPTRQLCCDVLRTQLRRLVADGTRVLVGFDFPFGYPAGFARALGLDAQRPWRAVWDELAARITDDQAGRTNNRFQVASDLNLRVGASEGPFWGHPQNRTFAHLHPTAPTYPVGALDRLRVADRQASGVQPVWKLSGNGSVGSQTLVGLPMLARLRDDDHLRSLSAVWPFETGCRLPPRDQPRIIFAEIYPSLVKLPAGVGGRVKDSVQVEAIARHLARHDARDTLSELFAAPATLEPNDRYRVETEEGWILGVSP
ncbi:MAG TPA: hypothetical protein VGD94_18830 [Vicinamibacterales bacterium]